MFTTALCTLFVSAVLATDKEIVMQLKPETLISTLNSLKTSGFFQKLADEFAMKTAERFIKELKKEQKRYMNRQEQTSKLDPQILTPEKKLRLQDLRPTMLNDEVSHDYDAQRQTPRTFKPQPDNVALTEEKQQLQRVHSLMETPPTDGDNLENESILTDDESEEKITVNPLKVYRINGRHFRRYDLYWK